MMEFVGKVVSALLVMTALACGIATAARDDALAQRSQRVEIYFVPWTTTVLGRLDVARVRSESAVRIEIKSDYHARVFVHSLDLAGLTPEAQRFQESGVHLVVDIYDPEGRQHTYYATANRLYSGDGQRSRAIDSTFRERFSAIPSLLRGSNAGS